MPRYKHRGIVTDDAGNILIGADVSVYLAGTSTPAKVWDAPSGGNSYNEAPQIITNTNGIYEFWVDTEDYPVTQQFRIVATYGNMTYDEDNVRIFPFSEIILTEDQNQKVYVDADGVHLYAGGQTFTLPTNGLYPDSDKGWFGFHGGGLHPLLQSLVMDWIPYVQGFQAEYYDYSNGVWTSWNASALLTEDSSYLIVDYDHRHFRLTYQLEEDWPALIALVMRRAYRSENNKSVTLTARYGDGTSYTDAYSQTFTPDTSKALLIPFHKNIQGDDHYQFEFLIDLVSGEYWQIQYLGLLGRRAPGYGPLMYRQGGVYFDQSYPLQQRWGSLYFDLQDFYKFTVALPTGAEGDYREVAEVDLSSGAYEEQALNLVVHVLIPGANNRSAQVYAIPLTPGFSTSWVELGPLELEESYNKWRLDAIYNTSTGKLTLRLRLKERDTNNPPTAGNATVILQGAHSITPLSNTGSDTTSLSLWATPIVATYAD